jgi:hypothetical protein
MKVHIPASIEEAKTSLDGLGQLLTAKQWERAAIVWAFTELGTGGPRTARNTVRLSIREFAELGIGGLRTQDQVSQYRKAWQAAIDDGQAQPVEPGDEIELPTIPWKDVFGEPTKEVQARVFRSVLENNPKAISEAVYHRPDLMNTVADQVADHPGLRTIVAARTLENRRPDVREVTPYTPSPPDYRANLIRALGYIQGIVYAIQKGQWVPSGTEALALHAISLLINEAIPEREPDPHLFAQIDSFLSEAKGSAR